jgi:hypothetical protein
MKSGNKSVRSLPMMEKEIGRYLESVFLSRFFVTGEEREEGIVWIGAHFPEWIEEAARQADRIVQEGIRTEPASPRQKWKRLLKEGTLSSFSRKSLSQAEKALFPESADQLLLVLSKGYWYTGRADYAGQVVDHTDASLFETRSWVHRSQGPFFPPWKGIWLLRFMVGIAPHEETERIWHLLVEQASRLSRSNGRESAEEGLFLLMMGMLFLEVPEAHFWKSQGSNMLERELFRRVGKDGVCRSKSLSDQVGLLFIYLQVLILARRTNPLTEKAERRIEKMLEFLAVQDDHPLMTRNGSRTIFSLQRTESDPLSKILDIGAFVFERPDLKRGVEAFSEEAFFLTGLKGYLFHQEKVAANDAGSVIFEEAGYAVLKSHSSGEKNLVFHSEESSSPVPEEGESPLPFSIAAPGNLFLRSPAIRLNRRIEAISSRSSRFSEGYLRNGKEKDPFGRFSLGDDFDYIEATQPLGPEIDRALRQKRSILFVKPAYWVIQDVFSGQGTFDAEWLYPFHSETKVEGNLSEGFHLTLPHSRAWIVPLGTDLKEIQVQESEGERRLLIRSAGLLPISLTTVIYPETGEVPSKHDFKLLYFPSAEGGTAFELLSSACTDTIVISPPSGKIALSSMVFEGEALFVRRDYLGEIARVFALSARSCYWEGKLLFESECPIRFLEFSYRGEVLHVGGELSGPISLYADGVEEVRVNGKRIYFTREKDRLHLHL